MDTFTIESINEHGIAIVTFSVDKKQQKMDLSKYVADKEALIRYLTDYALAYASGIEATTVEVAPEVTAMVGKPQEVKEEDAVAVEIKEAPSK